MPLIIASRARCGAVILCSSLVACILDPPEFPEAEPAPEPAPVLPSRFPIERVVEERASPPAEAAPVVVQESKPVALKKDSGCDPGEFSEVPASVRPLVGLWKNEENGRLHVRSDRSGHLSLSYEARGDVSQWTATLARSKSRRSDLAFSLTVSAVPDKRWRYEVNADGGSRLVGNVVETTTYTDGDGPEDSLPQPVSLVRLCGP